MTTSKVSQERLLRTTDALATVCALLVIPVIAIEIRATDIRWLQAAAVANWAIWLVFLLDAVVNLHASGRDWLRRRSSWLDIAVIAASFPVLPAVLASARLARLGRLSRLARSSRIVRLLRLTRLAILISRAFTGLQRILDPAAFPFVALAVGLVVVTGGIALFVSEAAEGHSLPDALWWAVTTVTTVGYGDVVPKTAAGRTIAVVVMLVGITFTSLLTANLAAYMASRREDDSSDDLRAEVSALATKIDLLAEEVRRTREEVQVRPTHRDEPADDSSSRLAE